MKVGNFIHEIALGTVPTNLKKFRRLRDFIKYLLQQRFYLELSVKALDKTSILEGP
jgi:hypothetical protein